MTPDWRRSRTRRRQVGCEICTLSASVRVGIWLSFCRRFNSLRSSFYRGRGIATWQWIGLWRVSSQSQYKRIKEWRLAVGRFFFNIIIKRFTNVMGSRCVVRRAINHRRVQVQYLGGFSCSSRISNWRRWSAQSRLPWRAFNAVADDLIVKIGHVGPISGPSAHLGKDNENGARMAIEDLNAKGVHDWRQKSKI